MPFKNGDIVKHKGSFLKSVGWYTDVPRDGIVTDDSDPMFPAVRWCDREDSARVHAGNIMLASRLDTSNL